MCDVSLCFRHIYIWCLWERADLLALLCAMSHCVFVTFPYGVSGKGLTTWLSCVRCLIVVLSFSNMVSLGKGWPLGSLVCDVSLCFCHFPIWCLWERADLLALLCAMSHCGFVIFPYGVSRKGITSWLSCVRCFIVFCHFPIWYLWERADLLALLCAMFHCVLSLSHMASLGKGLPFGSLVCDVLLCFVTFPVRCGT